MQGIAMVRVDDRLIHGQVMTSWLNYTSANKIMIIDDEVAGDSFVKNVLKTCVPANIMLAVFTVPDAVERLKKSFKESDKVIVLVKFPKTLHRLHQSGILFKNINIGGMGVLGERKKFYKNISCSEEEKGIFKDLIDAGSRVTIQIIAEDSAVDVAKLI